MLATSHLLVLAAAPPQLAIDFYTGAMQTDSKWDGPAYDIKDGMCCPIGSALQIGTKCSVQTQARGSDTYEQGSKNRTRTGTVVTWFDEVMKQMQIQPSAGTKHKYDCVAQCPINGTFHSTVSLGDEDAPPLSYTKPRHLSTPGTFTRPTSAGGQSKQCDLWRWEEKISVLPMGFVTAYVDTTLTPPQIFGIAKALTPFHAWENVSFPGFTPASQLNASLDDYFDIDPDSIANCPRAEQCFSSSSSSSVHDEKGGALSKMGAHVADAMKAAPSVIDTKVSPPPPALPNVTFVTQYTTTIAHCTVANQGAAAAANGDLCCSYGAYGAAPVCAASVIKTSGVRYYDIPNQRYRWEQAGNHPGNGVVSDYKAHKRMFVALQNGTKDVQVCTMYCPIDPRDSLKPDFFGFGNKVEDLGPATWQGKPAEHYHWVEMADPLPIPVDTIDFYADISKPSAAVPLFKQTSITPFGMPSEGYFNETYLDFKPGAPDPKKFDIANEASCKKAPTTDCKTAELQAERLALGQYHTFMYYAAL